MEADPDLLQASVHGEPEVVLKATILGMMLLNSMESRTLDNMLEDRGPKSQSPSILNEWRATQPAIRRTESSKYLPLSQLKREWAITVSWEAQVRKPDQSRGRASFFSASSSHSNDQDVMTEWRDASAERPAMKEMPTQCSVRSLVSARGCARRMKHNPSQQRYPPALREHRREAGRGPLAAACKANGWSKGDDRPAILVKVDQSGA